MNEVSIPETPDTTRTRNYLILEHFRNPDCLMHMKLISMSLLIGISVIISFSLWVGGASWLLVQVFSLSPEAGWMIAGILSASSMLAVALFAYEVRHAIELPDDFEYPSPKGRPVGNSRLTFSSVGPVPINPAPAFRSVGERF